MKILVISQYYAPEPGATSNRLTSFVEAMVKRGHEVDVICEFPNHPGGILRPEDKGRLFKVERLSENYRIIRTFVLAFPRKNNIKRMIFYLSFAVSSFFAALFSGKYDIVFTSSPPIFHAYSALIASKLKRTKFVLDIRDLWPDSAKVVDAVSNGLFLKMGSVLELSLYKDSSLITAVSKGVTKTIQQRGGKGKTYIIYNGTYEKILNYNDMDKANSLFPELRDKKIILYAGLMGLGQGLHLLLPEIKRCSSSDIEYVFIGDGPGKNLMVEQCAAENINNVHFLDHITLDEVIPYLYRADMLLVILKENALFKSAIPSKFFDCMAAGKPVLTNVDGELRSILEDTQAGLYFSLSKKGSLGECIYYLKDNPEICQGMGSNGKKLVRNLFLRSDQSNRLVELLESNIEQTN